MIYRKFKDFIGIILIIVLISTLFLFFKQRTFNNSRFNAQNEYNNVLELTSSKYEGRLAGTEGNRLALKYVADYFKKIGIEPGGDNGTYYQSFKSMVPTNNSKPYLKILDKKGNLLKEYTIGKDYRENIDGYGGNGEFKGGLFYLKGSIRNFKPVDIRGKIIVADSLMGGNDGDIEYAIDNGVKGILCPSTSKYLNKTSISIDNKPGKTIMINFITAELFDNVVKYAISGMNADMKLDEPFKLVESSNLFGKIEGRKKNSGYVIFSSHIDGFGSESNGIFYPGAMDGASGTSIIMELARSIKLQGGKPDKTIIFALWNNEEFGMKGKEYYVQNQIYPIDKSTIIYLNNLGGKNFRAYDLGYKGQASQNLKDRIAQFNINVSHLVTDSPVDLFIKNGGTALSVQEESYTDSSYIGGNNADIIGTPKDNIKAISSKKLGNDTKLILNYVKNETYGDVLGELLNGNEKIFICLFIIAILLIYIINKIYKINPQFEIHKIGIEDLYYSTSFKLFERFFYYLTQAGIIVILIVIITHIPNNFNIFVLNGKIQANFSWSQVLGKSMEYIRMLLTTGFGKTVYGENVAGIIASPFIKSFELLGVVLLVGTIIGVSKGIFDAFRNNENDFRATCTIMLFSLPDVFAVIIVQLIFIFFYNHNLFMFLNDYRDQKLFLETFLSLILLPTIYITRIASQAVYEEVKKEYIKAARAKGLSNHLIIKNHLLISVLIKVVESLPSILSLIISNLIIAEYLSAYNGIVTNMMDSYKSGDMNLFAGLALSLCFLYIVYLVIFKIIGSLLNPLKRRVIR